MSWKVRTIFLVNNPDLRVEDLNRGDIPQPMLIKTDSHGEKQITKLDASKAITIDRIKNIQSLHQVADLAELEKLQTHEKVIWLKNTLDKNTPNVTLGANAVVVSRDGIL